MVRARLRWRPSAFLGFALLMVPRALLVRDGLSGSFAVAALVLLGAEAIRHRRYWSERHARVAKCAKWLFNTIALIAFGYLALTAIIGIRDGPGWADLVLVGLVGLWLLARFLKDRSGLWRSALSREEDLYLGVSATRLSVPVLRQNSVWHARHLPWDQIRCVKITRGLFGYRNGLVEIGTADRRGSLFLPLADLTRRDAVRVVEAIKAYWPDAETPPSQQIAARAGDS